MFKPHSHDSFSFWRSNLKFVISDPENPRVQRCIKIGEFPKFHVRHIESAISKNGNPMSNSLSATSKALEYKVPQKSLDFKNIMFAILGPPFWIPKFRCQIHNQRPQKLLSTEFRGNRVVSKIACSTYWISAILWRVWLFEMGEIIFFLQFNYSDHRWS